MRRSSSSESPSPSLSNGVTDAGAAADDPDASPFALGVANFAASIVSGEVGEFSTENRILSASEKLPVGSVALRAEKMRLSASKKLPAGNTTLRVEKIVLSASPETRQLSGVHPGLSGSE